MPVIIVDDGFRGRGLGTHSSTNAGTCGWDVTAAETLFWEEVPVRLKIGGQDDRTRSLSIRIMMWDQTAKGVPKVRKRGSGQTCSCFKLH